MTAAHFDSLRRALYPGDGREAVAFALCGRTLRDREVFTLRSLWTLGPAEYPSRTRDLVCWRTEVLPPILDRASEEGLWLFKVHSHPGGWPSFSLDDDRSDRTLAETAASWLEATGAVIVSGLMLPDGRMCGRVVEQTGCSHALDAIDIIGDDLRFDRSESGVAEASGEAVAQAFGSGTLRRLHQLRVAVVGCSGTGSIIVEQLARSGVGTLILVDPDRVEERNLNRIVNATGSDAEQHTAKVEVMRRAVAAMRTGTQVEALRSDLFTPAAVRAVSRADVVFGCVDTVDARHLLSQIGSFYVLPYFDLGVKLEADGKGGVDQVCGSVHYLRPGGNSLLSRGVYTLDEVRAAGLLHRDPRYYSDQVKRGYIRGVVERRPAVISVNMLIAALAVNDLLARLHPYRVEGNQSYAVQRVSLSHDLFEHETDGDPCPVIGRNLGRGDIEPLLNQPELSES
jgi:hypothetical protein